MKKPEEFPHEHKAAGVVFQVYLAPLDRTGKDGTKRNYESFLVYYTQGGKRVPKRRSTWEDVETYIDDVVSALRKNDPERLELSGRDRRIYLAAVEALSPLSVDVDTAARDYVAAMKLFSKRDLGLVQGAQMLMDALEGLKGVPLSTALDFYKKHGQTIKQIKTVPAVVEELLTGVEADGCGAYHIRGLRSRLERFSASFPGPIHEIETAQITDWLRALKKIIWQKPKTESDGGKTDEHKAVQIENPEGKPVSRRTRNNYRDAINELFEFAKDHGYIARDMETEASKTKRVKVVPGKNHIISPKEAKLALAQLCEGAPHLVPFTVLKLFSGLRTEEAYGLSWNELRFKSSAVIIEAELAKLRQRRVPPILPGLAKWLKPFRSLKGPINPGYSSPQAVQKAVAREARKVKVVLGRNTFRNCYISYRVAQPIPSTIVAEEAGTSKRTIDSNYKELADKVEAKQWFSIVPSRKQIIELEVFVKYTKENPTWYLDLRHPKRRKIKTPKK